MIPAFTQFIDRMGIAAETDGMSPIAARLFSLLLLSAAPQSLDELADALGVSKASVSTAARRLLERGIVERVANAGDRRDYSVLSPAFFARTIYARASRWRRMQLLANEVRDQVGDLPDAVAKRIDAIDDVEASVIAPLEQALADWRAQRKQAAATTKRGAKARKR